MKSVCFSKGNPHTAICVFSEEQTTHYLAKVKSALGAQEGACVGVGIPGYFLLE